MNTLTSNRILEKDDEYNYDGKEPWKKVPKEDWGLQISFSKYSEVRRPSEMPPAECAGHVKLILEQPISPAVEGTPPMAEGDTSTPTIGGMPTLKLGKLAEGESQFGTTEAEIAASNGSIQINFPLNAEPCSWTGRNGTFNGRAINLRKDTSYDVIKIIPVGKRGMGNCLIEFPTSVIPQIVDWLLRQQK